MPLFKQRQNVSNLQILYNECSQIFYISSSLIIQQSLTLFYGTPRPRCEWREALASCSFRHGYHVFIPLINIKTKIINKYPILIILLFFCIKLCWCGLIPLSYQRIDTVPETLNLSRVAMELRTGQESHRVFESFGFFLFCFPDGAGDGQCHRNLAVSQIPILATLLHPVSLNERGRR